MSPPLVLASASAARRAVLAAAGVEFTVETGGFDETAAKWAGRDAGLRPEVLALTLAEGKAAGVAVRRPEALVIGADQILLCDGRMFDKPTDPAAARDQLLALRGRWHALVTSVVCLGPGGLRWCHTETPQLKMRDFSDAMLEAHLAAAGVAVTETVGGYRLEGRGIQLFEEISGDHFAILGLPLLPFLEFLRAVGVLAR